MANNKMLNENFDQEKMKDYIVRAVNLARVFHGEKMRKTEEYINRYRAKRSIAGLMGWGPDPQKSPKNEPWDNSSDVGIPIEAFTIEGLLPRFLKVCFGAKPNVWVKGRTEEDLENAETVQDALNYQTTKLMKIYRRMKLCYKNVAMHGDGIVKCIWEEEKKTISRTVYNVMNLFTNELVTDAQGNPVEVAKDSEVPEANEQGEPLIKFKRILTETKTIYDSPKLYSRNIKQIVVPKDADSPEIEDLDWIADQYERDMDWVKKRIGDMEDGGFDEKAVIDLDLAVMTRIDDRDNLRSKKVLITEWHGGYDVNNDGIKEEIVVFIGTKDTTLINQDVNTSVNDSKLLGWMITPYPKRPFFHYQIIPMDGSFYGIGIPEFLIGIRNLIDAIFNQMIDRGSINNNPPMVTPRDHDPDENPFGPGATWQNDNPNAYRVVELPKSEQMEFVKLEFLFSLVQKLFGITDFTPPPAVENQRTATGIMTIVGETNIKFDDMIRALQDVNDELYDFIVQLNSEMLSDEFMYYLTNKPNVFKVIKRKQWAGNFDFESVGNSVNINREIEQNRATFAYTTMMNSFGKNPVITPEVMRTVTENFFRGIDTRNVKLPSLEELQQMKINDMAQAIIQAEKIRNQQAQQQLAKGGVGGTINQ